MTGACKDQRNLTDTTRSGPGSTRYFKSFASYELPIRPVGEIGKKEAERLAEAGYAYYEAQYDESGTLARLAKHYAGQVVSRSEYFYTVEGTIERTVTTRPLDPTYGRIELYFDSAGRVVVFRDYDNQGVMTEEETVKPGFPRWVPLGGIRPA